MMKHKNRARVSKAVTVRRGLFGALKTYGVSVVMLAAIVLMILDGLGTTASVSRTEELRMLENNIMRAVVCCYAVEGSYPDSIGYLQENYGVRVDESKFVVHYNIFASNIMPDIDIREVVR